MPPSGWLLAPHPLFLGKTLACVCLVLVVAVDGAAGLVV